MDRLLLIKTGEIFLKGLNRPAFERQLMDNIRQALYRLGSFDIFKGSGRIFVRVLETELEEKEIARKISRVFGITTVVFAYRLDLDIDQICTLALKLSEKAVEEYRHKTFKIITTRPNKSFPLSSMEVSDIVGDYVRRNNSSLQVNIHSPDCSIRIELRDRAYLYFEEIKGHGGVPVGTSGKGLLLLSGGIDSPVAGYLMAKRGMRIDAVHFYSYPYTTEKSLDKVKSLANILKLYTGTIKLHVVHFTRLQTQIYENCPHSRLTILLRRAMMTVAQEIAERTGAQALITGEALGQVASQTLESIAVTNQAVSLPVFRPLIGMDKIEVIRLAESIGTYETSILPYHDCCTVFVAKHPETKPKLEKILLSEQAIDRNAMVRDCLESMETWEM